MARPTKSTNTSKKTSQTVRERVNKAQTEKPRRIKKGVGKFGSSVKNSRLANKLKFKLPDNRFGKVVNKRPRLVPRFIKNSWNEIRQVTWPNRRDTVRLTIAVFIFAVIFAVIVGLLDYVLGKIFKEVILKNG